MNAESQIEQAKIDLALRADFNCEDAFRIFELDGRGFLTEGDLKCGLSLLDVCATDEDVRNLMKRFDLNKEGVLNYADFFDMLVPYEKDYRNMVENRLPNSCCPCRCPDIFCCDTLCELKNVFNLIIDLENDINNNRRLFGTLRLKFREIFRLLDCPNRGFFSNNDLIIYLQKNGIFISNKLADLLFIRLDRSRNGNVFYKDIEDELQTLY
jgi:Ca2+-binding EF-hand superfamily protein